MAQHGGARNRSSTSRPDPKSARSEALGRRFGKLPREGYRGRLPAWPLTKATAREREVWNRVWRTPQAAAWISEPWRHTDVAQYVRWTVRMESPDAKGVDATTAMRLADRIGLSAAGLRENLWEIEEAPSSRAAMEAEARAAEQRQTPDDDEEEEDPRDRLRVVRGHGA